MANLLKSTVDSVATILKKMEEVVDPSITCLDGFPRHVQLDEYSCGAQCAFMILRYFGKARSIGNVTRELGTDTDGTSQYQIRSLLQRRGLIVKRLRRPKVRHIREAIDSHSPVLVSMDTDHWVVIYGYGRNAVYLADPSLCRSLFCRCSLQVFRRRWDTWAMIVSLP